MNKWSRIIQTKLDLPWLSMSEQTVPFGLLAGENFNWIDAHIVETCENKWELTAHSDSGLECIWETQFFPDTRSMECWGKLVYRGTKSIRNIQRCLTIDFCVQGETALGQPWIRTVNGAGRVPPGSFPPYDFGVKDRQILNIAMPRNVIIDSGEEGWSSKYSLPCAILCNEKQTSGLGLFLEWSGMWFMNFGFKFNIGEADKYPGFNCQAGIWGLDIDLRPGQSLPLPRLLITAFDGDLQDGGNAIRRHIRDHITPSLGNKSVIPPTSCNHYFGFVGQDAQEGLSISSKILKPLVETTAEAGLEYFCLDAGWHVGKFRESIGNWSEDREKFPEGIVEFANFVRSKGMKYGTWFEPEWANENSSLYREHPDWFWRTPDHHLFENRPGQQYFHSGFHLINLSLPEARQWWLDRIVQAYKEWGIRWIRWDFNQIPRPNWENDVPKGQIGWRQIEHVQGLYQLLDEIMTACPELLIEQCASGGHRIDLGTVRRGHSFWMNDHTTNTDIIRALQLGLNTVLPGNYANTNICQFRHDYTDYDFLSHGMGGFGYSGKLWEAPKKDFEQLCKAVKRFKSYRHLLMKDFNLSTKPARMATDPVIATFGDSEQAITMEFNTGNHPCQAKLCWQQDPKKQTGK